MQDTRKITFAALLLFAASAQADIYFENFTNKHINVKFKVCIEKDEPFKADKNNNTATGSDKVHKIAEQACKKYQDFEAEIAPGYRAKTNFDNITVNALNLAIGDKYSNKNSLNPESPCLISSSDKNQVIRFWLEDPKAANTIVACGVFEDKQSEEKTEKK